MNILLNLIEKILLLIIGIWIIPIVPLIFLLGKVDEYTSKDDSPIC
jgi:hypothetical protein